VKAHPILRPFRYPFPIAAYPFSGRLLQPPL
jgi:hypothetical protein